MARWLCVAGVFDLLVGAGFIFPAVAQYRMEGESSSVTFLLLGVALTISGCVCLTLGSRRKRRADLAESLTQR